MNSKIQNFKNKESFKIEDIAELVDILRSEDGCAWDREQTHKSVRNGIIEETYEFIEGLDSDDKELMQEELGDVVFQVFFHAQIAKENGNFDINDIADGICKKMILRHPHVFGDVSVRDSKEVLQNWYNIKKNEKSRSTVGKQLGSVPKTLPSLIRAEKLLSRYKKEGGNVEKDKCKLIEEILSKANNLKEDITSENIGELLFAVTNLSYVCDINSEQSLYEKNESFVSEKTKEL